MDDGLPWGYWCRDKDAQIHQPEIVNEKSPNPDQENPQERLNIQKSASANNHALHQAHGDEIQEQIKEHNEMDLHIENRWETVLLAKIQNQ